MLENNTGTTIRDIARKAGVSKATVSLVMNGSPKVSSKTCARVRSIIQNLNYQPNEEARKLAQRRWATPIPTVMKFIPAEPILPTI